MNYIKVPSVDVCRGCVARHNARLPPEKQAELHLCWSLLEKESCAGAIFIEDTPEAKTAYAILRMEHAHTRRDL
jgi:hypothetical protein